MAAPQDLSATDAAACGPMLTLVAGGIGGIGTADGIGKSARFNVPAGVALDGAGNLYITDVNHNNVRKMVLATGMVTTLAGNASMSGSADGTGTAALFKFPRHVAADGAGNLYIADENNHTIRKIVPATGVVTTLAGTAGMLGSADGTGAAALFDVPQSVAVDGAGNLYVADTGNHTIRKVVAATGVTTTIAGTAGMAGSTDGTGAAALFDAPVGVAVDGAGNLYIAEYNNHTIRKLVLQSGVVTTIAGTAGMVGSADGTGAAALFNQPQAVAVDGAGNLYVADGANNTIRKVVAATGVVTTIAGTAGMAGSADGIGAAARFDYPVGVAVDGAGNLYVAANTNRTVRKIVLATGVVITIAGTGGMAGSADGTGAAARFNAPLAAAADGAGNLYVTDYFNHTIRKVVLAGGVVTTLAGTAGMAGSTDGTGTAALFDGPYFAAADAAGNLYVTEATNHTIRKIVLATGVVTTLAGTAGMSGSTDGTGAAALFSNPTEMALDGAGNLYVVDGGNHTIRQVVLASAVVTTLAGTAGMSGATDGTGAAARFNSPTGLAMDGAGNLYVSDTGNNTIRKLVLQSGAVTTVAGTAGTTGGNDGTGSTARFNFPSGIAFDGAGNLYIADTGNGTIRKVVLQSASVTTVIGVAGQLGVTPGPLPGRLNGPADVAELPGGELIIVDQNENAVLRIQAAMCPTPDMATGGSPDLSPQVFLSGGGFSCTVASVASRRTDVPFGLALLFVGLFALLKRRSRPL